MKEISHPERVDLVDSQGVIQKSGVLRSETELYPELHLQIVIGVIVNSSGEVLVHKRSKHKSVNPGDIDLVCGAVMSGEKPADAMVREAEEETGLIPQNVELVLEGLNSYNRYRYLFSGTAEGTPSTDVKNAEWVKFLPLDELKAGHESGEMTFVDEFFVDLESIENK